MMVNFYFFVVRDKVKVLKSVDDAAEMIGLIRMIHLEAHKSQINSCERRINV